MRWRCLVFDLDGTLAPHDGQPHARLLPMLQACRRHGLRLLVATARRRPSALQRLGPLRTVLGDGVFNNGANTWLGGHLQHHVTLPRAVARRAFELVAAAQGVSCASLALPDDGIAFSRPLNAAERSAWGVGAADIRSLEETLAHGSANRICAWSYDTDLSALCDHLHLELGSACHLQLIDRGRCLFVMPPGLDKQAAIARLCAAEGIPAATVIAFGDDLNDVSLLRWAGIGVAMADGHADLRAVADRIAPPSAEGGIASILPELIPALRG